MLKYLSMESMESYLWVGWNKGILSFGHELFESSHCNSDVTIYNRALSMCI